jgi:hypothetical protein
MTKNVFIFLFTFLVQQGFSQTVEILSSGTKTSIRGLSVVDDRTIWVSGSNGTVARSIDGGNTWNWMTVTSFEKTDFRDIEAFDDRTAIIMGISEPAHILRTVDGGKTWTIVFEDSTKGMFLDAMEFKNEKEGRVIGDPIDGRLFIANTTDGGLHWTKEAWDNRPIVDSGEACFASSGTNIRYLHKRWHLITGGMSSKLYKGKNGSILPVIQGKETTGANSIAGNNQRMLMIVGGDFNNKDATTQNIAISYNGGHTFQRASTPPHGYRSCIEYIDNKEWITCGLNGVDITKDNGNTFTLISNTGFHVCRKAKKGTAVFFAGGGGRIGILRR